MTTTLKFDVGAISHTEGFNWTEIMLSALNGGALQEGIGNTSTLTLLAEDGSKLVLKGTFNVTSLAPPAVEGDLDSFKLFKGAQRVMTASFTHEVSVEDVAGDGSQDATENDLIQALLVMFGDESVKATGSADHDAIYGGMADDTLNGGSDGGDWLTGFAGDDRLNGGSNWDDARYNREFGTMNVIVNLGSKAKVVGDETVAGGHARDTYGDTDTLININFVSGTKHDDVFFGRDGDGESGDFPDFVSGAKGADTFTGGKAALGVAYDQADIEAGGGKVRVNLSADEQFGVASGHARDTYGNIDTLVNIFNVALSQKADTVVGGGASEHFWGRGGADLMYGNKGKDQFEGDAGKDTIDGGKGMDTLTGGLARDKLTGGSEADQFVYLSVDDSEASSKGRDIIMDFKHDVDLINLAAIDANETKDGNQKFKFDGMGDKDTAVATGHIGWYQIDKADNDEDRTILRINVDDKPDIDMSIELKGLHVLDKGDFIL